MEDNEEYISKIKKYVPLLSKELHQKLSIYNKDEFLIKEEDN